MILGTIEKQKVIVLYIVIGIKAYLHCSCKVYVYLRIENFVTHYTFAVYIRTSIS